jgi:Na+/proline symporter
MSSTAGELNALGSTTSIDFYKRVVKPDASDAHYLKASKWLTAGWGAVAVGFALFADLFENLIEAVNILGSIFYGTILGIFLTAFFLKRVKGNSVFMAALIAQSTVFVLFVFFTEEISYLYYNVIGCGMVMALSAIGSLGNKKSPSEGAF